MPIDGINSAPLAYVPPSNSVEQAQPVAPPPPPAPAAAEKPTEVTDFSDAKPKPVSITGKFSPPPIALGATRDDLKDLIANARSMANVNSGSPVSANVLPSASSLVASAAADDSDASPTTKKLRAAIKNDDDRTLREIINHDPSTLKDLTPEEKGAALEVARSGYRSEGDSHLMKNIVESCTSKSELRKVIAAGRDKDVSELTQKDFHVYDKEIAAEKLHPYLIADKLNPDNALPETAPAAAPKKAESTLEGSAKLMNEADAQMKAGNFEGARKTLEQLKNTPTPEGQKDFLASKGGKNGVDATLPPSKPITNAEVAAIKLGQVAQAEKMSNLVGQPFDATNPKDVRRYFDAVSKDPKVTTANLRDEFATYVKNFHTPADKVDWGPNSPPIGKRTDPEALNGMFQNTETDRSGRRALDCEGHSYLTGAIFSGNPRFDVTYASDPAHITAIVTEKKSPTKGFSVNTLYPDPVAELNQNVRANGKTPDEQRKQMAMLHHGQNRVRGTTNISAGGLQGDKDLTKVNQARD
ncbi:MAG: hypothetical protein JNM17_38700 [Archangium sp.]|nr:hypothetical protein [Archangium sp.]